MSTMQTHLEDYLRLRRALGFTLTWPGHVLPDPKMKVTTRVPTAAEPVVRSIRLVWLVQAAGSRVTL